MPTAFSHHDATWHDHSRVCRVCVCVVVWWALLYTGNYGYFWNYDETSAYCDQGIQQGAPSPLPSPLPLTSEYASASPLLNTAASTAHTHAFLTTCSVLWCSFSSQGGLESVFHTHVVTTGHGMLLTLILVLVEWSSIQTPLNYGEWCRVYELVEWSSIQTPLNYGEWCMN